MQNIWGYVEGSAQPKSQKKKWRVEKEAPYRLYRGGEGEGLESKETRDSRLSEAKRGCRTAVFHGRFGSDVDRDDKRERRTVTGRREKERSLLTPHLPFSWSVFKVFYFQRDVRGWKTKGMGWQIKEQRKLHSERILSLSLPPLPPFFALSPLFSLLLCLLSLQRFSSRSHRTFSPDSVSSRPPRRLSFCRHSPRIDNILAGKKDRFLHKPEKWKKKEWGKIAKQDRREKGYVRSTYLLFDVFPIFPFFPGHEILKLPFLLSLLSS